MPTRPISCPSWPIVPHLYSPGPAMFLVRKLFFMKCSCRSTFQDLSFDTHDDADVSFWTQIYHMDDDGIRINLLTGWWWPKINHCGIHLAHLCPFWFHNFWTGQIHFLHTFKREKFDLSQLWRSFRPLKGVRRWSICSEKFFASSKLQLCW